MQDGAYEKGLHIGFDCFEKFCGASLTSLFKVKKENVFYCSVSVCVHILAMQEKENGCCITERCPVNMGPVTSICQGYKK